MNDSIVVATDFSEQASAAISHAAIIAQLRDVELVLVHALNMPAGDYSNHPYLKDEILNESQAGLHKEKDRLEALGLRVSIRCEAEAAGRGILAAAEACNASLVVIGSHGRKGLSRLLLGSVAEYVARHAACDVLVARGAAPETGYHRLLVPTDFSEVGELVVNQAINLVDGGGDIELLHCWELPGVSMNSWAGTDHGLGESIRKGVEEHGEKWRKRFASDNVTITFSTERGDPRHVIEDRTQANSYDLVVMGSHRRKGMQRLLLGSVAETMLRHLKMSVYIRRPRKDANE